MIIRENFKIWLFSCGVKTYLESMWFSETYHFLVETEFWRKHGGWARIYFHLYKLWKVLTVSRSVMSDSLQPQWTIAHQAPLSMDFSRQEYWSGLPFFSPRDLPDPGIEPRFPALQVDICVCVWRGAGLNFSLLLIFKLKDNCFTKFCCAGRFFTIWATREAL